MPEIIKSKILRFIMVGTFNTLLGFFLFPIIYFVFSGYRMYYFEMLVICHLICIANSYFTNKHLVFCTQGNSLREMMKFVSFHGFYFVLTLLAVPFFTEHCEISPVIGQLSIASLIMLTSYFWYNKVTFLSQK